MFRYLSEDEQWSFLLRKQEEYYQSQLRALVSVLTSAHNAIRNVTEMLNRLDIKIEQKIKLNGTN